MQQFFRKLGLISLPAIYWLAVTFAPLLHDHTHHSHTHHADKHETTATASHTCSHHHHHGGHKHSHSHSHRHPHSHAGHHHHHEHKPGTPLHDDDCAACRFLALKPAPTAPVSVEVVFELLPQDVPELIPAVERIALPLPESRGPPAAV